MSDRFKIARSDNSYGIMTDLERSRPMDGSGERSYKIIGLTDTSVWPI